jgi:2-methylcitrate dehydratase PrpD
MTAPLTRQIADFIAAMPSTALPEAALGWVRTGFTDCAAVILAGTVEPVTRVLRRVVRAEGGIAESRVCLGPNRAPAPDAALITATAAHALDWDDYAFSNHPSAVLVPTVLAVAEPVGADGRLMAAAYVAGYEVWAALMRREPDHLHSKGWHPTGAFGPIAAAAAAAVLLRLDAERAAHAVALAASHAGGVMANFGTMTKPFHGGKAAQSGIQSARLAAAGMTAGPDAIESPIGLLHALSPKGAVDRDTPLKLADDWSILRLGLNIKKYPTVGASQRSIDGLLALRQAASIDPGKVRKIIPRVSAKHAAVMPFHRPATSLQAKFSLEFATSCAILAGRVSPAELTDAFVTGAPVRALIEKVEIATTDEIDPDYPGAAPYDVVRVVMEDGRELVTEPVRRASGHATRPLSTEALWGKFADCALAGSCPKEAAHRLFEAMQRVDTLSSVDDLPAWC